MTTHLHHRHRQHGPGHRRPSRPRAATTSSSLARTTWTPQSPATSSSSRSPTRPSADVIAQRGEQLAGKIVVDITNPLNFETFDSLVVPADSSAAAEIAAALPGSRVLKAFNTTFAGTLAAGTVGPLTTTVLIAGDDADAKSTLAGIVTSGGLNAIDAIGEKRARELEALGFLRLTLAANEKVSWTGGFGVIA